MWLLPFAWQHYDPPPPVPDLPPFLNIALPFESSVDTGFVRPIEASQSLDKPTHIKKTLPTRRRASSSGYTKPSAPVTVAQKVSQQYAAKQQQMKDSGLYRARALAAARLTPSQVVEIVRLTGAEIRQRGIANVGILRPFRVGSHPTNVDRLAELFLLSSESQRYDGLFSVSPPSGKDGAQTDAKGMTGELALATLGRPSANKELVRQLAFANIHDVGDFLKWSVRRLKLDKSDFASETDMGWYKDFVKAEKDGGYTLTSFSDDLLPRLPVSTRELLTSILDLLTTISAHFVANAMPASRVCKTWGFWLFGRIGQDKSYPDFLTFLGDWKRSTGMMEHLMMAFIRDQSVKAHSVPTRLAELIESYPGSLNETSGAPGLPNGVSSVDKGAGKSKALKLHMESERLLQSLLSYRGPPEILHCALNAHVSDCGASAEADDWSSLLRLAHTAARQTKVSMSEGATAIGSDGETAQDVSAQDFSSRASRASKLTALLTEEQSRILEIYAEEFANRRKLMGIGGQDEDELEDGSDSGEREGVPRSSFAAPFPSMASTHSIGHTGMTSSQSFPITSFPPRKARLSILAESVSSGKSSGAKALPFSSLELSEHRRQPSATVSPPPTVTEGDGLVDWTAFRQEGFASESPADLSLGDAEIHRTLTSADLRAAATGPDNSPAPHQDSSTMSKLRRHTSLSNIRRRAQRQDSNDFTDMSSHLDASTKPEPSYSITSASTVELDEGLVSLWQDAVLDPVASANLPSLVFVALNRTAASSLMSPAGQGSGAAESTANGGSTWLMIEETVVPHRPQMPKRATTGPRPARFRSASSGYRDNDAASLDGKRSIFAPSMRSIGASILRKRPSLKKISSFATLRRRRSGVVAQANADAAPIKDADPSKKETAPASSDAPLWSDASGEASATSSEGYVLVPAAPTSPDAVTSATRAPREGAAESAPTLSVDTGAESADLSMTMESALLLASAPDPPAEPASIPRPVPVRSSSIKRSTLR